MNCCICGKPVSEKDARYCDECKRYYCEDCEGIAGYCIQCEEKYGIADEYIALYSSNTDKEAGQ